MKKGAFTFIFWLALSVMLQAQEKKLPVIAFEADTISFFQFAEILEQEFGIWIYYNPQWIKNLKISSQGDSVGLDRLLDEILNPAGIKYYYPGNNQVFLTGMGSVADAVRISPVDASPGKPDTSGAMDGAENFGKFTYERAINKVTIGDKDRGRASGTCYLSGRITNSANGEPVIGAAVVDQKTGAGIISDGEGSYVLPARAGTTFNLKITCMGMENKMFLVEMNGSGILNIEMDSKLIGMKEVVVMSGINHNVRGMQMGFQRIGKEEMKTIPVVMGERDILKIANMMPGVQTVGEGAAGFNVRGSSSDQNLFIINDIPVLNTGHLFGFFSAFNPDMVSSFNLYKSNFPAEYGGRLASVFNISTRKGNKKEFGARGSLSPVTASLLVETPVIKEKSSFIMSVRSTYSDWILDRLDDAGLYKRKGSFYDVTAGMHILGKNNSSWQFFGYFSRDNFALSTTNLYHYGNLGGSLAYDKKLAGKWSMKAALVFSDYDNYTANKEQDSRAYEHRFAVGSREAKLIFTGYPGARHKTGFGGNMILHNLDQGVITPTGSRSLLSPTDFGKENGLEYALHISDEITLTDNLVLYGGLRYSFFNYLGPNDIYAYQENRPYDADNIIDTLSYGTGKTISHYSGPEYRLSLNYELMPGFSMKVSCNKMRQYLFMLSNTLSISPTDRWKLTDPFIAPPVSDQVSLGFYKNFNKPSFETSAEIYFKNGKNTVDYRDGADINFNPITETLVLQGTQKAWGTEFLIRKNTGRITGWISYAYSRSVITVNGDQSWQKINMGLTYPANYDKPHSVNFVGTLKISRRLSLSSNIVYNTGRPVTYPTGIFYVNGYQVINYSLRNEYRIPDYFRTDISVNLEGNLRKNKFAHSSWMFSVYNVTGRRNAYSVYFNYDNNQIKGYKLSIYGVPIFTISYNFKLGNYAVD